MNKEKNVSLDTMLNIGKKKKIAGREYKIAPVNIEDMHYILGEDENKLVILDKKALEEEKDGVSWQLFGLNVTDTERKKIFLKILNKYVRYNDVPMTEELLIEHNWSFKEIGEFLFTWCQVSD